MRPTVHIGADHRGFELKEKIILFLKEKGYSIHDAGTHASEPACDYPLLSQAIGSAVSADPQGTLGILVCMTGIGHSIAANKFRGVRAALCYNKEAAALSRQHNNANVLVLGSMFVTEKEIYTIITTWLNAEFEGGRHERRVQQIADIESDNLK